MTRYRFEFRSSFAGVIDYDTFDGPFAIGKVSVTMSELSPYWRNHTANPAQADSSLGILRWHGGPSYGEPAPADMVDAFNAWRLAEYATAKAEFSARYPDDWERYFPAPWPPVVAGRFNSATGYGSAWARLPWPRRRARLHPLDCELQNGNKPMTVKWKRADAKAAIEAIALAIADAFNIPAPACYVPDHIDQWEWRIDRANVWTKAGAAELAIEIDADFAHMYFRFDDPARAAAVTPGNGRLNPHSGKWNSLIGAPDSLADWIASLSADFGAVAEPNPPAAELAAWKARQADQAAYWERAEKSLPRI